MTLFEILKRISRDSYAETKTPGELAALIEPWLVNLCSDPVMRRLSGVHTMLRAAESLTDVEDLEPRLFLIGVARKICRTILNNSLLPRRLASLDVASNAVQGKRAVESSDNNHFFQNDELRITH